MCRNTLIPAVSVLILAIAPQVASGNAWVLEPSIKLDVGYDDNYEMVTGTEVERDPETGELKKVEPQSVTVSKVTGEIVLRRQTEAHYFRGGLLADAEAYQGADNSEPNANQVLYFYTTFNQPRYRWGANFRYRRDSLLREAEADTSLDLPAEEQEVQDATVDQLLDVTRHRIYFNPFYRYNLTRRTDLGVGYELSYVDHDETSNDVENYTNQTVSIDLGRKVTPRDKLTGKIGFSLFTPESTEQSSNDYETGFFRIGYERSLSPTFTVGGDVGLRITNFTEDNEDQTEEGPIASVSAVKKTGLTRFELLAGLELYPSSIGEVVQTQELVANVTRNLSELSQFSVKSRFYENTVISGNSAGKENENDRRNLTIRPEISWQLSREWKVGAAYRYRREKLEKNPSSAEGNALLFSVKYTFLSSLSEANPR